ncbi:hypothetical protein GW17_00031445 [Ensete ventricosum]|nr:hypothetical protein GW17_00031445 [Ensete ventricosum]
MTLWLQVETVAGCDCNRERRATERTTVAEEHSVSMERETAADNVYFYSDFHCARDALVEVSQQLYQSQAKEARRRGGQPRQPPCRAGHPRPVATRANPLGRPALLAGAAARRGRACGHIQLQPAHRGSSQPRAHPQRLPAARRPRPALPPAGAAALSAGVAAP